jgi:sec-independent protein translocase protein TatA
MSGQEILVIVLVALLLFGAEKLPGIAKSLGKGLREFKKATDDIRRELEDSTSDIRKDLNDVTTSVKQNVNDFSNNIKNNVNDVTDSIRKDVNDATSDVAKDINDFQESVKKDINDNGDYPYDLNSGNASSENNPSSAPKEEKKTNFDGYEDYA